jgi:hypothetical protein
MVAWVTRFNSIICAAVGEKRLVFIKWEKFMARFLF